MNNPPPPITPPPPTPSSTPPPPPPPSSDKHQDPLNVRLYLIEREIENLNNSSNKTGARTLRERVLLMNMDINIKAEILKKLDEATDPKMFQWIENITRLPLGVYNQLNQKNSSSFLVNVKKKLDLASHGNENVKEEILEYVARLLNNPGSSGNVLALEGERGTGKTRIIKEGLAKSLDRPFFSINFGGMKDTSLLLGHSSTYMGSKYGVICDILMKSKCMNPIIYLDEIDKIGSNHASEIYGVLTHLLDESQNKEFLDNYFDNIKIDLSKVLFVISYNNPEEINVIARDRMKIIKIKNPSVKDKISICKFHIIPEVVSNIGFKKKFIFSDEVLKYIITKKTNEPGTRGLKRIIESVLEKINLTLILKTKGIVSYQDYIKATRGSYIITIELIEKLFPESVKQNDFFTMYS